MPALAPEQEGGAAAAVLTATSLHELVEALVAADPNLKTVKAMRATIEAVLEQLSFEVTPKELKPKVLAKLMGKPKAAKAVEGAASVDSVELQIAKEPDARLRAEAAEAAASVECAAGSPRSRELAAVQDEVQKANVVGRQNVGRVMSPGGDLIGLEDDRGIVAFLKARLQFIGVASERARHCLARYESKHPGGTLEKLRLLQQQGSSFQHSVFVPGSDDEVPTTWEFYTVTELLRVRTRCPLPRMLVVPLTRNDSRRC